MLAYKILNGDIKCHIFTHLNMLTVAVLACYHANINIQLKTQLRLSPAESQKCPKMATVMSITSSDSGLLQDSLPSGAPSGQT